MSLLAEGIWNCTVLSATSGASDGVPFVQIKVRIDDGPSAGRQCTYERDIDTRSAKYAAKSMKAVGWKGGYGGIDIDTIATDCAAWIERTGGKSTVEISHIELKRGKAYDKWVEGGCKGPKPVWDKPNSIGRSLSNERQLDKLDDRARSEANEALARAMAEDGGPPADVPPPTDDDIPFVSCSLAAEPRGIARVIGGVL